MYLMPALAASNTSCNLYTNLNACISSIYFYQTLHLILSAWMDPRWFIFGFFSWPLLLFSRLEADRRFVSSTCATGHPVHYIIHHTHGKKLPICFQWSYGKPPGHLQWYESIAASKANKSYFMSLKYWCQEVLKGQRTTSNGFFVPLPSTFKSLMF